MLSFRQKIFLTYLLTFLILLPLIYPGTAYLVQSFIHRAMDQRASEFIHKLQSATDDEALVRRLRAAKHITFMRISIITDQKKVLYDSHAKRLLGPRFAQEFIVDHQEVIDAFSKGKGYNEDYSDLLGSPFIYFAKAFNFHDKTYVIRVAFPQDYISETSRDFQRIILLYSILLLGAFGALAWLTMNHFTRPIQRIIEQVRGYKEDSGQYLPFVHLPFQSDEFSRLANTLNSLSAQVQQNINTLTAERNEKTALLDSLIEGVIACDDDLNIIYCNKIAAKMLSLDPFELEGKPITVLQHKSLIEQMSASRRNLTTLTGMLEVPGIGGKIFLGMLSAPKGVDGGAILILQDQSEHHRILAMRKQFIANASHELKTPITIIRGFAETLHDNTKLSTETIQGITSKIVKNCQRMTSLIKDLLALADIENLSTSRLHEINLIELLEQCRFTLLQVFPNAQIEIAPDPAVDEYNLLGDPSLLEMAFYNLLNNAAKYSNPPAKVKVSLSVENSNIELLFADQGIGIPEDDLENIFQRFYTVDSERMKKTGGSGLGLSIVETIIEKHYGKIEVTSKVGVGTTFRILLPINSPNNHSN